MFHKVFPLRSTCCGWSFAIIVLKPGLAMIYNGWVSLVIKYATAQFHSIAWGEIKLYYLDTSTTSIIVGSFGILAAYTGFITFIVFFMPLIPSLKEFCDDITLVCKSGWCSFKWAIKLLILSPFTGSYTLVTASANWLLFFCNDNSALLVYSQSQSNLILH